MLLTSDPFIVYFFLVTSAFIQTKKMQGMCNFRSLHFLFLFYFVLPVTFFPRYSGGSYSTSIGTHYCKSPTLHFLCLLKDTLRIEHHKVATKNWDDPEGWNGEGGGFRMGNTCIPVADSF